MRTDALTESQAAAAAQAAQAVLFELRQTRTAAPEPLDPATRQVLEHLATDYLHAADAAYRQLHTLLPPVLHAPGREPFADVDAAQTWYGDNVADLIQIVKATSGAGIDELCWRLPVALEPLMIAAHDQPTWNEIGHHALAAARRCGDDAALARTLLTVAGGHRMGERFAAYTEAADLYARLGDKPMALITANRAGITHLATRNLDSAEQHFRQVIALTTDNRLLRALAHGNTGVVYRHRGDYESALTWGTSALNHLALLPAAEPTWTLYTHIELAEAHIRRGDTDAGQQHLDQARALLPGAATRTGRIALGLTEGLLYETRGQYAEAATVYQDLAWLQLAGTPHLKTDTTEGMARAAAGLGQDERAATLLDDALTDRRRVGEPVATARALSWSATTAARLGHADQAAAWRAEALNLLTNISDPAVDQLRTELSA